MSNHVKIRPVRTDLFHADVMTDRQTDRRTDKEIDMTKLIVAFRNFANALKKNKTQGLPILIYAFYKDIKVSGELHVPAVSLSGKIHLYRFNMRLWRSSTCFVEDINLS
jgi:hypothetical protein